MFIEVRVNVIGELVMTKTSELRKRELKLGEQPTSEGQRHWSHPVITKNDDK